MVYDVEVGGSSVVGLTPGDHYWAISLDNYRIQLAESFCKAIGAAAMDPTCIIGGDGSPGDPFVYQPREILPISTPSDESSVSSLVLASHGPIGGLRHRGTYFVVNENTNDFQLSATLGGAPIPLSDSGGNGHIFRREGADITGAGTGRKKLVLDLSSGGSGLFEGVGGAASFAVPSTGDGVVTSPTTGDSGGFIDVGSPDARATVTNSTTINVFSGANLTAQDVIIETEGRINAKAVGKSDGVGFVALAESDAFSTATNNSAINIQGGTTITALDDLTVSGSVTSDVDSDADSDKVGFFGSVKVRSRATESHHNTVTINGQLTAGDELKVLDKSEVDAYARSYADADGVGANGDANDTDGNGARVGQNGSVTTITIQSAAELKGREVMVHAYTRVDAEGRSGADCDALGADCDARADANVKGTTEARIEKRNRLDVPQIDGTESIRIEAGQSLLRVKGDADADCSCVGGDTDARSYVEVDTFSLVTGVKDALLRTALLDVRATAPDSTTSVVRRSHRDGGWFDGGNSSDGESESHGDVERQNELGNFATGNVPVHGRYLFAASAENYPSNTVGGTIANGDRPTGNTAYLTANDFISVRHLTPGPISYTGIVNSDADGDGVGSVVLLTTEFINAEERIGNFKVDDISSSGSDVTLWALGRILDWEDDPQSTPDPIAAFTDATPTTGTDIRGESITLFAGLAGSVGGVGNAGNYLEIDVDVSNGNGVLNVLDIFASSTPGMFIAETSGDLELDTVWTTNDVSMYTIGSDINDARNNGAGEDEVNVLGETIDLDANDWELGTGDSDSGPNIDANIGDPSGNNDLEIDSSRGSIEDVSLEADGSIFVTEADAKATHLFNVTTAGPLDAYPSWEADPYSTLELVLARAWNGDIRLTVRDEVELPEDDDLHLKQNGNFQRAEDELLTIGNGTIIARHGYVLLRVGDDVDLHQNSNTLAGKDIDIYGDAEAAALAAAEQDPGYGTDMLLRGRIIAGCVSPTSLDCTPDGCTLTQIVVDGDTVRTTEIWGYEDIDQIWFADETGIPTPALDVADPTALNEKTTHGDPGYIFLGSQTFARGSDDLDPAGDAGHDPSVADGEDEFGVYYLQTANVLAAPAQLGDGTRAAGHSLTLDGQADTDYYDVWTTGSRFSQRNYVVNVLDTGAEHDGVDELAIHGRENADPQYNGYEPGTVERNPNDDLFLLRAVKCIDTDGSYGIDPDDPHDPDRDLMVAVNIPTTCDPGFTAADGPEFVALLHGDAETYKSREVGDESSSDVQRIHYDAALNGRVSVYGYEGNDEFYVDDTTATATLDGGAGFDKFQIGQIFGTKRDQNGISNPTELTDGGMLLPQDTFPTLVPTTRGWLSPGTHAPLVATGGTGNDEFVVYSP